MSYNKLFEVLQEDNRLISFISNLSSGYLDVPYLIKETLNLLEDESPMINIVSDNNKKALCIMLDMYFTDCWELYIEDIGLDKLIPYGKIEVYKIDAANGLRYATVNEVAQGIKGLIGEYIYPSGEDFYKNLCLLYWTFTGKSYYFRQAGYQLEYDNNGKVTTPFYSMIQDCAVDLKNMFKVVSIRDDFNKHIKKIEKLKKNKGYKYASFEKDEITEDITIKQLVYNIYKVFPRNSTDIEYRRALALAIKSYKNNVMLSPLEISWLRDIYTKHAMDRNSSNSAVTNKAADELRKQCESILSARYSGKIDTKHFVFTIIETIKKNKYQKCSNKQYKFIEDALAIINKDTNIEGENDSMTEIITDSDIDVSLESLSDAIGSGLFDDEELED